MRPLPNITGETAASEEYKEMRTRMIAAAFLVPTLLIIALVLPKEVAMIVMGLLQAIAAYELLYRTRLVTKTSLVILSAVMAFVIALWSFYGAIHGYFVLMMLIFFLVMFGQIMRDHVKVRFEEVSMCFVGGVIIPYLMSALVRILATNVGRYVVLIPFFIACVCDAGAYFVGVKFGKHKLAPVVSPNKTIEGALGGLAAGVLSMLLYAVILDLIPLMNFRVHYGAAMVYGLLGCLTAELGDLCFSVVKRQTGIKDYGNLVPGHGGVLDRFDSVAVVAPLVYLVVEHLPMV